MKTWLTALILAVSMLGAPGAHAAGKPELRISQGTVKVVGGRLKGYLIVRNAGSATSGRTTAQLAVMSGGPAHVIERYLVLPLEPGQTAQSDIDLPLPSYSGRVIACAPKPRDGHQVPNRCRDLGVIGAQTAPVSSNPTDPISYPTNEIFSVPDTVDGTPSNYWAVVPSNYVAGKPMKLLIWLHGCGGQSQYEIEIGAPAVRGGSQDWITISPGGREQQDGVDSGCWDAVNDQPKVYAALADVESHFNVDVKRVVIGGYSAGGDLAYRTAFDHSLRFAGVLAENTSPFRDTKQTQSQALAEAAWKFNLVHLAHRQDEVYHYAAVQKEVGAMVDAGFPVTFLTRPGTHYDTHTEGDAERYLIPHMDDGWAAP